MCRNRGSKVIPSKDPVNQYDDPNCCVWSVLANVAVSNCRLGGLHVTGGVTELDEERWTRWSWSKMCRSPLSTTLWGMRGSSNPALSSVELLCRITCFLLCYPRSLASNKRIYLARNATRNTAKHTIRSAKRKPTSAIMAKRTRLYRRLQNENTRVWCKTRWAKRKGEITPNYMMREFTYVGRQKTDKRMDRMTKTGCVMDTVAQKRYIEEQLSLTNNQTIKRQNT